MSEIKAEENYTEFWVNWSFLESQCLRREEYDSQEDPVRNEFVFSSNHKPSEARIKRYTHNDPIMSAVP